MPPAAVLLSANYDSEVGYAWNNIYRLYNVLARAFADRGLHVVVSFPRPGRATFLDPDIGHETIAFDPRRVSLASAATLKRHGVRYAYLTDQPPTRWDYALLRAHGVCRIVVHSRVSVPDPRPARPATGMRRVAKTALARVPGLSVDRVYAVSNFVRDRLVGKGCFPADRVRTILNGIDVDAWTCDDVAATSRPATFFAAARAARYKGILTLIEAAALVRDRHGVDDFRVRYAGDGPDLGLFKDTVARLELSSHVALLGRLDDTRAEVCGADVIVVPSMNGDACPSTVSEALASGRPLITTRAGGIPELVGDASNAWLILPGDTAELATAMAALATDAERRRALGARGRSHAQQALQRDAYHQTVVRALFEDFGLA